jgi:formylglycine-generating enzyme required for sulfatase activity
MDEIVHRVMRFDRFVLDLTRGCVRSGDQNIELRPKTFEVLHCLVENAGRLVPKQEIFATVWPNVVVGDDSLVQCIRELRAKLGDDEHRLIKTVSRRGYLLDATVTTSTGERAEAPAEPVPSQTRPVQPAWGHLAPRLREELPEMIAKLAELPRLVRGKLWRVLAVAVSVLACSGAVVLYLHAPSATRTGTLGKGGAEATAAVAHSPRRTFRDCDVCPEMVELPAGEFAMGSPEDEYAHQRTDGPQRRVVIAKRFALGKLEVTVGQFESFVAEAGLKVENACSKLVTGKDVWEPTEGSFRQPGFGVTEHHPAVCVSWHEAQAYATWLGRRTGRPYRLPSEAEWEYAARAGTTSTYSFGSDEAQLCDYARFADLGSPFPWRGACRNEKAAFGPLQAGSLKANRWGLFDMHGNAWEWVADCWTPDARNMPTDGTPVTRPGGCEVGVARGGGWATNPLWVRSAHRISLPAGRRLYHVGFRVALSLGP